MSINFGNEMIIALGLHEHGSGKKHIKSLNIVAKEKKPSISLKS